MAFKIENKIYSLTNQDKESKHSSWPQCLGNGPLKPSMPGICPLPPPPPASSPPRVVPMPGADHVKPSTIGVIQTTFPELLLYVLFTFMRTCVRPALLYIWSSPLLWINQETKQENKQSRRVFTPSHVACQPLFHIVVPQRTSHREVDAVDVTG